MPSASSATRPSPGMTGSLLNRPGLAGAAARAWTSAHATDYLTLAAFVGLGVLLHIVVPEPFHRLFRPGDPRLAFPHADHERVSVFWLLIYVVAAPLALLAAWAIITRPGAQAIHAAFLGQLLSLLAAELVTDVLKNAVGRPRPDLLARCHPREGLDPTALVGVEVCTETSHHLLHDGWRSWPSGHSSSSFAGLGFTALFLVAQMRAAFALSPASGGRPPLPLALLPAVPLLGAALIAASRTEDYRHDGWDVTSGAVLGLLCAIGAYRRYWPSPWSSSRAQLGEPLAQFGFDTAPDGVRSGYTRAAAKDEEAALPEEGDSDLEGHIDRPESSGNARRG